MDQLKYGTRLYGYSLSSSSKGRKLKRFQRCYPDDEGKEFTIGYIESTQTEKHGPVTITIWVLKDGRKYHYVD